MFQTSLWGGGQVGLSGGFTPGEQSHITYYGSGDDYYVMVETRTKPTTGCS